MLCIVFLFIIAVNIVNGRTYDNLQNGDLLHYVLWVGSVLFGGLIVSHLGFNFPRNIKRWIMYFQINTIGSLPFFIFFTFSITNDGLFPEFNYVMALFLSYIAYLIYRLLYKRKQRIKNELYKRSFVYITNIAVFSLLLYLSNTTDDRGEFSTRVQFEILTWLFVLKIIFSWFFEQWKQMKQLKNEKINTELMHLKSQMNPHFFFNTLNNLYGLTREKSDDAPDMVLKLSNMMRYTIYEGKKEFVSLQNEIEYIENFIELHKIRYHKDVEIRFSKEIDHLTYHISPLLYINLVENAFKHGVEHLTADAYVHLHLVARDKRIIFTVENNYDPDGVAKRSGIGIQNLKRRLELLYPKRHNFTIEQTKNVFKTVLEITV